MSNNTLPIYFDPRKYASNETVLRGSVALKEFKELSALLVSNKGDVVIDLSFKVDDDRRYIATGNLKAQVELVCQRCMQPVLYDVDADLSIGFVYDEEHAKSLPAEYDPVVMTDGEVVLANMVEEELILALPVVAYHDESGCNPIALKYASSTDEATDDEQKPNPFSILAQLKAK